MKKLAAVAIAPLLTASLAIVPYAHGAAKKKAALTDADIQKCIEDKLGNSKLKSEGITSKVSGGEATLEGSVKVSAHKGNASQIATKCGAQKVTNNITVPPPKPKK